MKELKKEITRRCIRYIIVFLLLGTTIPVITFPKWKNFFREPVRYEDLDISQDLSGTYVTGTIDFVFDAFCEDTKYGLVDAKYYIIDYKDHHFMALRVDRIEINRIEQLMHASWDYFDDVLEEADLNEYAYHFTGEIQKMSGEYLEFYDSCFSDTPLTESQRQMYLPYCIVVDSNENSSTYLGICCAVAGCFYLCALFVLLSLLTGRYTKSIRTCINKSHDPAVAKEKVMDFLNNTKPLYGVYFNHDYICVLSGCHAQLCEASKLVWAYRNSVSHKYYELVTLFTEQNLILKLVNGKQIKVFFQNTDQIRILLVHLGKMYPWMITGYSEELSLRYEKSRDFFLDIKYNPWHKRQIIRETENNSQHS